MNTQKIITLENQTTKIFLFQVKNNEYVYVGDKVTSFKANVTIVIYPSDLGFNGKF